MRICAHYRVVTKIESKSRVCRNPSNGQSLIVLSIAPVITGTATIAPGYESIASMRPFPRRQCVQ